MCFIEIGFFEMATKSKPMGNLVSLIHELIHYEWRFEIPTRFLAASIVLASGASENNG